MEPGLDGEGHFFFPAHDRDRHRVARGDEERRVDYIFRLVHRCLADPHRMSPSFAPESAAGVPRMISVNCARTFDRMFCGRDVDSDPAVARFAETDEVAPNFFRRVDRQRVTSGTVIDSATRMPTTSPLKFSSGAPASPR